MAGFEVSINGRIWVSTEERGLSQEALADAAQIGRSYMSGIERGVRNCSTLHLFRIAKALRVQPGALPIVVLLARGGKNRIANFTQPNTSAGDKPEVAHELLIEGVRAAMFYVNERPWHGLGTRLTSPPTSQEAIRAAGLDWRVVKTPLYIANQAGIHQLPARFALVREDKIGQLDCHFFGIVGRQYVPLQNVEAFEFFDPLVRDGSVTYETAGALRHGERVWIQARLGADVEIVSGDAIQRYLLLSTSHDGSSSVQVKLTPVRVVCNNTLTQALSKGRTIRIPHDRDMRVQLEAARAFLGFVRAEYDEIEVLFRRMAATKLSSELAQKYFETVFPDGKDADTTRRAEERRLWAMHFYRNGKGHDRPTVKDTMWAAYNGVTEFVDHCKRGQSGPDTSPARLASVWFGQGATVKERALKTAAEWAGVTFSAHL